MSMWDWGSRLDNCFTEHYEYGALSTWFVQRNVIGPWDLLAAIQRTAPQCLEWISLSNVCKVVCQVVSDSGGLQKQFVFFPSKRETE